MILSCGWWKKEGNCERIGNGGATVEEGEFMAFKRNSEGAVLHIQQLIDDLRGWKNE